MKSLQAPDWRHISKIKTRMMASTQLCANMKTSFTGRQINARATTNSRSAVTSRFIVRAEGSELAKVERVQKAGGLYANFASEQSLTYLNGTLPGDYGFDPLGLSDPEGAGGFIDPSWLSYSEVIHGRWAMLGAAGCIAPEILASAGVIPQSPEEATWFRSGVIPPAGSYDKYWVDPYTLFFVEVVLMQFAELKRWQDFKNPGSQGKQYFLGIEAAFNGSGNPSYPGGSFFNMASLGKTDAAMNELKLKEIKNGRLAMLAMFGYGAQAVLTGTGPYENLKAHLADPVNNNMLTNFSHVFGQ